MAGLRTSCSRSNSMRKLGCNYAALFGISGVPCRGVQAVNALKRGDIGGAHVTRGPTSLGRSTDLFLFYLQRNESFPPCIPNATTTVTATASRPWARARTSCTSPTPSGHPRMLSQPASVPALGREPSDRLAQTSNASPSTFALPAFSHFIIRYAHPRARYSTSR